MLSVDGSPCLSPRSPSTRDCCDPLLNEWSLLDFPDSLREPNNADSMEDALNDDARRNSDDTAAPTPATVKLLTVESNGSSSSTLGLTPTVGDTPSRSTWSRLCRLVLLARFLVLVLALEVKFCPVPSPGSLLDIPR